MKIPKHLPEHLWPAADRAAFDAAYVAGDIFDETAGTGAHLAEGTRKLIKTAYRRWLGFLRAQHGRDLELPPAARITRERVRQFIEYLSGTRPTSVAIAVDNLYFAARLISPASDWNWLRLARSRLNACARPEDRFPILVAPWRTLDLGVELMDGAAGRSRSGHREQEIQYRDGLILALLSVWPIRRRSIAALTITRHVELNDAGVNLLLGADDTKGKRAEEFSVPHPLVPYFRHYLEEVRPRLLGGYAHDGLWVSYRGERLSPGRIYDIVRARVFARFGKRMGLHDFRRAAATFLAISAPEKVGLTPGILQHASPDVGERHYNQARSVQASERYAAHLAETRARLRRIAKQ